MFDRPRSGERAVLVHLDLDGRANERELVEFQELAGSAGALATALVTGSRRAPDPRSFAGSGKVDEIRALVGQTEAELVIFDHELSPSQERNLEREFQCRVIDRTGLILDIFAQRARSHEGKLQVELAQLRHLATRLVRGWTHLERQKGGIGLRGPGETQLETDRRLLGERIKQLLRRLERVGRQRDQGRHARRKAEIPSVSLVGYTNAGKSTLFNRLTSAGVYAADQLFATLDPTLRRLALPGGEAAIVADTVGFISRLPHELVAAFKATLQEVCEADLLLHVIDASDSERDGFREHVDRVLEQIGAHDRPRLLVFNKIDRLAGVSPRVDRDEGGRPRAVWLSAANGAGIDVLVGAIAECLGSAGASGVVTLPPQAGAVRARLYALHAVVNETVNPSGEWVIQVSMPRRKLEQVLHQNPVAERWLGHLFADIPLRRAVGAP